MVEDGTAQPRYVDSVEIEVAAADMYEVPVQQAAVNISILEAVAIISQQWLKSSRQLRLLA